MSFTLNTILESDLRDSAGHTLKVVEITGVEGDYTAGGIIVNPSDFGFGEIVSIQVQPITAGPDDLENPGDPWKVFAEMAPMRTDLTLDGTFEWRVLVFLHPAGYGGERGDGIYELPDGTPLQFFPQLRPTMTIIGA